MLKARHVLLSTTALTVVVATSAAVGDPLNLVVSAPAPGETRSIEGSASFDSVVVGTNTGERGELTIRAGQSLTSGVDGEVGTRIGRDAGAVGAVLIDGAGATWNEASSWFYLGQNGTGSVAIRNGGALNSTNVVIGSGESGVGVLTVDGAGSLWTGRYIEIGRDGVGTVTVSGGAGVQSQTLRIGFGDGVGSGDMTAGKGLLTVTGPGSHWINSGHVALQGDATLRVDNGGTFETVQGGFYVTQGGSLTVTGTGSSMKIGTLHDELPSSWESADGWFSPDSGTILIAGGARLESDGGYLGGSGDVLADMTVTGAGTVWENHLGLYVGGTGGGGTGTGVLRVLDGARASGYTVAIGVDPGSTGTVIVAGEGSVFKSILGDYWSGKTRVGYDGTGTLVVRDGGAASTDVQLSIGENAGSKGVVAIGALEGEAAAAPGTIESRDGILFGAGDATLVFNHTSSGYEFAHVLSGSGGLIRQVSGVSNLTGDSSGFSGQIDVIGGTLEANGKLGGAAATVFDGGTLGGSGQLGDVDVKAGGTLAPGNSPGTLTVAGLSLEAGSILGIDIDGTGHDRVVATTKAVDIADGAVLQLAPLLGTRMGVDYRVIELGPDNDESVNRSGGGFVVQDNRRLIDSFVDYSPEDVTVRFAAVTTPWSALFGTPNRSAVAASLQGLDPNDPLYLSVLSLADDVIDGTFDQLAGEVHASAKSGLMADGEYLRSTVFDRLGGTAGGSAPLEPQGYAAAPAAHIPFPGTQTAAVPLPSSAWTQAYGGWGSTRRDGNAAALNRQAGGVFFGADTMLGDWLVGLVVGYGQSYFSVADRSASGSSATYQVGGYAATQMEAVDVRGGASYAFSTLATERTVAVPGPQPLKADYSSGAAQVFGEVGYSLDTGSMTLRPFAGLALVNLSTSGYAETGGPAALHAAASNNVVGFSTVGVSASAEIALNETEARLTAMVGWRHAAGETATKTTQAFANSQSFVVGGPPIASDALLLQLGLGLSVSPTSTLDLSYDGEFSTDTDRQVVRGSFTNRF